MAWSAVARQPPVPLGQASSYAILAGSTVTNAGASSVLGDLGLSPGTAVTGFPPGALNGVMLAAAAIRGTGWSRTLATLNCTPSDALAAGASYPDITATVSVANDAFAFHAAGSPAFQAGDILLSMSDGTVQWRCRDWTPVSVLPSVTSGQAKGMAFDSSGNLLVTHWYGSGSSGNYVMRFDKNGDSTGPFGSGFDSNPSSSVFDKGGNAYAGHADCGTRIFKFDSPGNPLAKYSVAIENRGSGHIVLDPNQCTMYHTPEGANVKRFDVCSNMQMPDFNTPPLPDPDGGAHQFVRLPGGGMLVANFSVIALLDAAGNFVHTCDTPTGNCWLGVAPDADGTSFRASNWCASTVARTEFATGDVRESRMVGDLGSMVKQILIPGNIFATTVANTASMVGGGELNSGNNSATDLTSIDPPAHPAAGADPLSIRLASGSLQMVGKLRGCSWIHPARWA